MKTNPKFKKIISPYDKGIQKQTYELRDFITDLVSTMPFNHVILIGENFNNTKIVSPKISVFETFQDFKTNFDVSQLDNFTLLIKGSRGMALERALDLL